MSRIIFSISYPIITEKRDEFLETIGALKEHLRTVKKVDYSVYEQRGKSNHFSEVYICKDMDEYDKLEDEEDEVYDELIDRITNEYVRDSKIEYRTLIEAV